MIIRPSHAVLAGLLLAAGCKSAPPPDPVDARSVVQRMATAGDAGDWEVYVDCLLPEDRPVLVLGITANMASLLEPEEVMALEGILREHQLPTVGVIQSFKGGPKDRRAKAQEWAGNVDPAALLAELCESFGRGKVLLPPVTGEVGEAQAVGDVMVVELEQGQAWCVTRDGRWYLSLLDRPEGSG